MVEQNSKMVEQSTSPATDIIAFAEARSLHRRHSVMNPHLHRNIWDIYNSVLKLGSKGAEKDVDGRSKVLLKKTQRKTET